MGIQITPPPAPTGTTAAEQGRVPVSEPGATPVNATAAVNTAVVATVTGVAGQTIRLLALSWSYNAAPTGGRMQIQDGATTILDVDVAASGPGSVPLPPGGIKLTSGNTLTATLAAAGAAVTGKVNLASIFGA